MIMIIESGVQFGWFENKQIFRIEHSDIHKSAGEGIKTVEFILCNKKRSICLIEAKSSCPNVANKDESEEKSVKYEEFFREITDKFVDSVNMYAAAVLGRYPDINEIGEELTSPAIWKDGKLLLILVVANAEESWLVAPQAELEKRLLRLRKIWKAEVVVMNREIAEAYGIAFE